MDVPGGKEAATLEEEGPSPMFLDDASRRLRSTGRSPRRAATRPGFEPLEGRLLLSSLPPTIQNITYQNANYTITVSGPGSVRLQKGKGASTIALSGTTSASSVSIVQTSTTVNYQGSLLPIAGITIKSAQLGQILGGGAIDLVGTIQTSGAIQSIQLGEMGPASQIIAKGGLGSIIVTGDVHLGPKGKINVTGDLTGGLQAGSIELTGGQIVIGHNLGNLTTGGLSITANGQFSVGNDAGPIKDTGEATVSQGGSLRIAEDSMGMAFSQDLTVDQGQIAIGRDLTAATTVNGNLTLNSAQILVGRDAVGSLTINGSLSATTGANLTVARDAMGGVSVNGNLVLASGSYFNIGRNLGTLGTSGTGAGTGLVVGGNLSTASGGAIQVVGNLEGFNVGGVLVGQGSGAIDLSVGLDLDTWSVMGGMANMGGVENFNLNVGKDISGMTILHGLFDDFITAGVLITNGVVGPDGPVAVFDTEIRAGVQITATTFTGDVISDRPTNPSARLTRIVAGEDRGGNFELGGNMDTVMVTGSLINSVLAAAVQPYGGNGTIQLNPVAPPADGSEGTYDAPLGGVYRSANNGNANGGISYAAPPFNTAIDPNVQDRVLAGSINHSYAPAMTPGSAQQFPTKSTVDGAVLTTGHANGSDYAGIFAEDTSGVFVGTIPPAS